MKGKMIAPEEEDLNLLNINLSKLQGSNSVQHIRRLTMKKSKIESTKGFRILNLRQNLLGSEFAKNLENCFCFDRYLKRIDLSHNKFKFDSLKEIVGQKLRENSSLVSIDLRFNPGATSSIIKQACLCMLKTI
jgi:Ran GTPase-activating protein (RanGAP) involved in mRNA processing and transport